METTEVLGQISVFDVLGRKNLNKYSVFYSTNSQNYETYNSFNKIQSILPDNFIRCHKSYIANTENISNINTHSNKINFNNNLSCEIGPKYKNNLMEVFKHGNFTNNMDSTNNGK